jgi:hypothetical protein
MAEYDPFSSGHAVTADAPTSAPPGSAKADTGYDPFAAGHAEGGEVIPERPGLFETAAQYINGFGAKTGPFYEESQLPKFAPPVDKWKAMFDGDVDTLSTRLPPDKQQPIAMLNQHTQNDPATLANAVLFPYISEHTGMTLDEINANPQAVLDGYAKHQYGIDKTGVKPTELYQAIRERLQQPAFEDLKPGDWKDVARYKLHNFSRGAGEFWESITRPFYRIPDVPALPDVPSMGPQNPALVGGVAQAVKPLFEGIESPLGVATLGVGSAAKAGITTAKIVLGSMSAVFTGLMAKAAVEQVQQIKPVLDNPNSTFQEKVTAVANPVVSSGAALLGGLETVHEIAPHVMPKLSGKTPAEAAVVLREAGDRAETLADSAKLYAVADQFHAISDEGLAAQQEAMAGEGGVAHEVGAPKGETATVKPPVEFNAYGTEEGFPETWNLTRDIPVSDAFPNGAKAGSTVSRAQMEKAGYDMPEAPEPMETGSETPRRAEIQPLDNGGFIVTDTNGHLIDYAETAQQAKRIKEDHERGSVDAATPEGMETTATTEPTPPVEPSPEVTPARIDRAVAETESKAAESDPAKALGISNESVNEQLAKMGREAPTKAEKLTHEAAMETARAAMEKDPLAGQKLVDDLERKPRPATPEEDALLARELNRLRLEHKSAQESVMEATNQGDTADLHAAQVREQATADAFDRTAQVIDKVGTEQGRALAFRRIMLNEDYSLAGLKRKMKVANQGKELTAAQTAKIEKIAADYAELDKKFTDYRAEAERKQLYQQTENELLKTLQKTREESVRKAVPSKASRYISDRAAEARARIRERMKNAPSEMSSGTNLKGAIEGVEDLADHLIIGAEYAVKFSEDFAKWSKAMVKEFGDYIKPHLNDLFERSKEAAALMASEHETAKATQDVARGRSIEAQRKALEQHIAKLEKQIAENDLAAKGQKADRPSVAELETLKQQRDALREEITNRRETAAKVKELEQAIKANEAKIAEGDLSTKNAKVSRPNVETVEKLKQERDALNEKLAQARRDAAVPEQAEARIDKMNADIAEKERKLREYDFSTKQPSPNLPLTREMEQARQRIRQLNADLAEMRRGPRSTEEESSIKADVTRLTNEIDKVEKQLSSGEIFDQTKKEKPTTPEIDALKQKLKALKEQRDFARESLQPKEEPPSPEEIALKALKTRAATRIKELEAKIAKKDFGPKPKRTPPALDKEAISILSEKTAVEKRAKLAELEFKEENRTKTQKVLGAFQKWVRAGALSWPTVLLKLSGAALIRTVTTPIEQAVGFGLSKLLPDLADAAPREGVPSLTGAMKAEAKALSEAMTTGLKGSWEMLQNKDTETAKLMEKVHLPPTFVDYLGKIHGALKNPTKINEFARSLELRTQHALAHGIDPTDPIVQIRLMHEAYMDANRAIFLQDNAVVDAYKAAINRLEAKNKETGKPSLALQLLSTGIQSEMPIVKVPTNVIAETSQVLTGALTGPVKAAFAYAKGIENLSPAEADSILRLMKKGSIGLALTALGVYKAKDIGGFYQKGEKRDQKDVKAGDVKAGDVTVPHVLLHNPYMDALQFGATIERAASSRFKKGDLQPKGYAAGVIAASTGLIEEVPFIRETSTIGGYLDPHQQGNEISRKLTSIAVPGVVQWLAAQLDKKTPFSPMENATPRKADGLKENFEKAIPGLREKVPVKKAK